MEEKTMTYPLFSYRIFGGKLEDIFLMDSSNGHLLISTINPHSFYVAEHDSIFKKTLQDSQILLPDGIGVVYANMLINGKKIRRISGMDLFLFILKTLEDSSDVRKKVIFFLGASDETLRKITARINREYPSLIVKTYSPPFKPDFDERESAAMVHEINRFSPHVLFVGMTAPKQEKWSYANAERLNAKIICPIGAVFDFYGGTIKRPGKAWQFLGLEWLRRFANEPTRLWRRSFISLPFFLKHVVIEAYRKRILRSKRSNV